MKTLPVNLRIENIPVLMVGGGQIAAEKLAKLLPHRPRLTVLCAQPSEAVRRLAQGAAVRWISACYSPEYLEGQAIVFAATSNPATNRRIFADTRGRGMLLNAVDMPECCDFIMPAVVSGTHFSLAISTGGLAAGYARQWREQIEADVRQEDGILEVLEKIRDILKRKVSTFDRRRERLWTILRELEAMESEREIPNPKSEIRKKSEIRNAKRGTRKSPP